MATALTVPDIPITVTSTSADPAAALADAQPADLPAYRLPVTPTWVPDGFLGPYWTDRGGVLAAAWMDDTGAAVTVMVSDDAAPLRYVGAFRRLPVRASAVADVGRQAWWEYANPRDIGPDDQPGSTVDVLSEPTDTAGYPAGGRLAVRLAEGRWARLTELPASSGNSDPRPASPDGPSQQLRQFAAGLTDVPLALSRSIGLTDVPPGLAVAYTVDGPTFGFGWPELVLCPGRAPCESRVEVTAHPPAAEPDGYWVGTVDDGEPTVVKITVVNVGDRSVTMQSSSNVASIRAPEARYDVRSWAENPPSQDQIVGLAAALTMPADERTLQQLTDPFSRAGATLSGPALQIPLDPVAPTELAVSDRWWPSSSPVTVRGRVLLSYQAYPDGSVSLQFDRMQQASVIVEPDQPVPDGPPWSDGPPGAVAFGTTLVWRAGGHRIWVTASSKKAARALARSVTMTPRTLPDIDLPAVEIPGWEPEYADWTGSGSDPLAATLRWRPKHPVDPEADGLTLRRTVPGGDFDPTFEEYETFVDLPLTGRDDLAATADQMSKHVRIRDAKGRAVDTMVWIGETGVGTEVDPEVLAGLAVAAADR